MNKYTAGFYFFAMVMFMAWAAPIIFSNDPINTVPEELKNEIIECKKKDGSDKFEFVIGSLRTEYSLLGVNLFFEQPNTKREKTIKYKKFIKSYLCRKDGTSDEWETTKPKQENDV